MVEYFLYLPYLFLKFPFFLGVWEADCVAFISILAAVLITMIAIGIQRPGTGHVDATTSPAFYQGFLAVTNIVFAYGISHVPS